MTSPLNPADRSIPFPNLPNIVADLRNLRMSSHHTRYGAAPTPELPSKPAIIEIIDGLVSILFPRHFGPPGLVGDNLDAFVTVVLSTTLRSLQRQVRLELNLTGQEEVADAEGRAQKSYDIARRFADQLADIRGLLESDIKAAFEGDPAATGLDEVICCYPGVAAIIRHRLAHSLYKLGAPMLARIVSEVAHSATGIDIHPGAQIGGRFFIDHGTGVVIGETAIIGAGVRIYQGVTLGARRFEQDSDGALSKHYDRHPIIEDDVVIYAGASVLGRIIVGRGSTIAGSVWLTRSVPPMSVVTQVQARRDGVAGSDVA